MLSEDQIWIVNAKLEGKLTNREIASVQGISIRMVQQLYSEYKTANYMFIKRLGDINSLLPNMKSLSFTKFTEPASYIGKILRAKGYNVDNNRINQILKEGLAMSEPKK